MTFNIHTAAPLKPDLLSNYLAVDLVGDWKPQTNDSHDMDADICQTHSVFELAQPEVSPKLAYLQGMLIQLLLLALLISFAGYAKAANETMLAANGSKEWVKLASLVEDEKSPLLIRGTKHKSSWALALDNDILAPGHRDRDYTYGINFTYSGAKARDADISLKTPLSIIDGWFKVDHLPTSRADNYSLETGFFGFTPEDKSLRAQNPNDRPYASLIYFSSSHEQIDPENNLAWKTTLTIGALGLGLVGDIQNVVHDYVGGQEALGWDNQISEGGELTGRYVIARQHYLENISDSLEVKSTWQASVGYLTEASWSLSFRDGKIRSPWSSFNPELISYGEKSTYTSNAAPTNEQYFWSGITIKARAYNVFLQGQFRDSAVKYDHSELNPFVAEAWVGYTYATKQGYRFSYVLRAQTSEIKDGDGDRNVVWGGVILSKTI